MVKSQPANVIDLESFRERRKMQREERPASVEAGAMLLPVWFCWVPMWTPFVG